MKNPRILVIIPARGGSKGIPRKNLRPLNNKPLIYYAIQNALNLPFEGVDCYVSSEDPEILGIAKKLGAQTHKRPSRISEDAVTLDPVIHDAFKTISDQKGIHYDLVITMQPTSPLLESKTVANAIDHLFAAKLDTLISGTFDSHLTWIEKNGSYFPNYEKRVNRQELPRIFKETGGFVITRSAFVTPASRFGQAVEIFPVSKKEAIDIDNFEDWSICEFYLKRKKILFVLTGNNKVGMGHAYNTLSIAHEILNHEVEFLVDRESELAAEKIRENNYRVGIQGEKPLWQEVLERNPDVVINDRLDTEADYMRPLKEAGKSLINFEDLGPGAEWADLVINAMYPEGKVLINHYFGAKYFILKDDFILTPIQRISADVGRILISFGGVDPNNYTARILKIVVSDPALEATEIRVILGMGYEAEEQLRAEYPNLDIRRNISDMASEIRWADLAFTSAGRTTFEIAALGTPAIVLCQNHRETTHFFASEKNGFYNLGLGTTVSDQEISNAIKDVLSKDTRELMHRRMIEQNLKKGKQRVLKLINNTIEKTNAAAK